MSNALDELVKIMPPPKNPVAALGDWGMAEHELGTALPNEFKRLISLYGDGQVCHYFEIISPFCSRPGMGLKPFADGVLGDYRIYRDDGTIKLPTPCPIFPEPGGVLPFSTNRDSHHLNWKTQGSADEWPLVIWDVDFLELVEFQNLSLAQFFLDVSKGPLRLGNRTFFDDTNSYKKLEFTPTTE